MKKVLSLMLVILITFGYVLTAFAANTRPELTVQSKEGYLLNEKETFDIDLTLANISNVKSIALYSFNYDKTYFEIKEFKDKMEKLMPEIVFTEDREDWDYVYLQEKIKLNLSFEKSGNIIQTPLAVFYSKKMNLLLHLSEIDLIIPDTEMF